MKKLILVRHGKSSWNDFSLADHDRPLAGRGKRDAPEMAKRLKKRGISPDFFLSSTALRAKHTAEILAKELDFPMEKILTTKNLYHASSDSILREIQKVNPQIQTLLVFGHNPGFNDFVEDFGYDIGNLPTSGQFCLKADIDSWSELRPGNATSAFFDYPKKEFKL